MPKDQKAEAHRLAKRCCDFLEDSDHVPARRLPDQRTSGVIDAQLLVSWRQGRGGYRVIGVDRSDGSLFRVHLGDEFRAYCLEHLINKNPRATPHKDLSDPDNPVILPSMPHIPLFAHFAVTVDLDTNTLTKGKWLGNSAAMEGFERAKGLLP